MAIDWGGIVGGALGGIAEGLIGGGGTPAPFYPTPSQLPPGTQMPGTAEKVTVDLQTGKVTKCRRRRRRPLLTPTDLATLAQLKALAGGGQAFTYAVMKAVRR